MSMFYNIENAKFAKGEKVLINKGSLRGRIGRISEVKLKLEFEDHINYKTYEVIIYSVSLGFIIGCVDVNERCLELVKTDNRSWWEKALKRRLPG